MTEQLPNDYDGAWKAALDVYLKEFLELCFPAIHAAIDWSRPYRFLETELQRASSAAYRGRRTVGKLVEVWGRDGAAASCSIICSPRMSTGSTGCTG